MRVCWNRQTGTFEGRVSMTYEFKSRHSHHIRTKVMIPLVLQLSFFFYTLTALWYKDFCRFDTKNKFHCIKIDHTKVEVE